jgi:hypothetical protein
MVSTNVGVEAFDRRADYYHRRDADNNPDQRKKSSQLMREDRLQGRSLPHPDRTSKGAQ